MKLARGDRDSARAGYETAAQALQRGAQLLRCIAEQRIGRMDLEDSRSRSGCRPLRDDGQHCRGMAHTPSARPKREPGWRTLPCARGDLETADAEARRVVDLTEQFRHAGVNVESRALGFGALSPAYERAIAISMQRAERGDSDAAGSALVRTSRRSREGCSTRSPKATSTRGRVCHRALPRNFDACATSGARV